MDAESFYLVQDGEIEINAGRDVVSLVVANTGDRPIQVGSHAHFFEVNRYLRFDRALAFGKRLDIPAGLAVRFEPGDEKEVTLVSLGGDGIAMGVSGLTTGPTDDQSRAAALERARANGFGV